MQVTHLQHPGGRVHAILDVWHAGDALKVTDQLSAAVPRGAKVDGAPSALQQQQLKKRLRSKQPIQRDEHYAGGHAQ